MVCLNDVDNSERESNVHPEMWEADEVRFVHHRVTEGIMGVSPSSLHVFLDLEKAYDPQGILWGVPESLLQGIQCLYNQRPVSTFLVQS